MKKINLNNKVALENNELNKNTLNSNNNNYSNTIGYNNCIYDNLVTNNSIENKRLVIENNKQHYNENTRLKTNLKNNISVNRNKETVYSEAFINNNNNDRNIENNENGIVLETESNNLIINNSNKAITSFNNLNIDLRLKNNTPSNRQDYNLIKKSNISKPSFLLENNNKKFGCKYTKKVGKITDFIFNRDTNLFSGISFNNTKYVEFLFGKIIINSFIQFVFALISILSGFIQYELSHIDANNINTAYKIGNLISLRENPEFIKNKLNILLAEYICFITTIGLLITFFFEFLLDCELNYYLKKFPEKMWRRDKRKLINLFKNIVLFICHPNPVFHNLRFGIYNYKYDISQVLYVNDVFFSLLLLRLWFIFKLLVVFSDYSSARTQRICNMNNFSVSFSFCMKALMQNIPYHVYSLLLGLCLIFCSCNLRIYERGLDEKSDLIFSNYWNCIWCIIITMTTVGFGDYYPSSIIGRIIGIISCFMGVFLISMLVVTITNVLNLTPHEQNVYMILEKVNLESQKYEIARDLIAKYFNIIRKSKREEKKGFNADNKGILNMKFDFLKKYNNYLEKKADIESTYPPYSNYDAINEHLTYLETEFNEIEDRQNDIADVINKICNKLNIF